MFQKNLKKLFLGEIWIVLGLGTWPNVQVCHNYVWGQLLILHVLIFGAFNFLRARNIVTEGLVRF